MTQAEFKQAEAIKIADDAEKLSSSNHTDHENGHEHEHPLNWREINRVLFVAAAAGAIWFLGGARNPYMTGIGVICAVVGGFPIFHEAYENIVQRRMTMELSMAIAIVAALAIREIFTALVITLFVLMAEILEGLTVGRGRTAILAFCLVWPDCFGEFAGPVDLPCASIVKHYGLTIAEALRE